MNQTYFKIQKTLKKHSFHPYKVLPCQKLSEENKVVRLNFSRQMLNLVDEDGQFLNKILWTDEAHFSTAPNFNRRNCHYWAQENPHALKVVIQV